jgi:hypothetical protein
VGGASDCTVVEVPLVDVEAGNLGCDAEDHGGNSESEKKRAKGVPLLDTVLRHQFEGTVAEPADGAVRGPDPGQELRRVFRDGLQDGPPRDGVKGILQVDFEKDLG